MHALIVFASGAGSNCKAIIQYFECHNKARVALIVTSNAEAGVLAIAADYRIPTHVLQKGEAARSEFIERIEQIHPALIILAGFLWRIPDRFIQAFPRKIINIHPALLPEFGGKGMYGAFVHQAVLQAHKTKSGITIHYVDEQYDHGDVIMQAHCAVQTRDTPETLAARIHRLEHFFLPRTVDFLLAQQDVAAGNNDLL